MNADERQLITSLFERMRSYGTPDKDREAEALIAQLVRTTPDAAYMLVQSVLVQEQALQATNERIQDLEEQLRAAQDGERPRGSRSGSFLGGASWPGRRSDETRASVPQVGARATPSAYENRTSPWSQGANTPPPPVQPAPAAASGGGFMRSALTTAAGVAGGMLLADSLRNMLGGGAHASSHREGSAGGGTEDARYENDRDNDPGNDRGSYEDDGNDPGFDSGGGGEIEI